jgi:hypothetical protein
MGYDAIVIKNLPKILRLFKRIPSLARIKNFTNRYISKRNKEETKEKITNDCLNPTEAYYIQL